MNMQFIMCDIHVEFIIYYTVSYTCGVHCVHCIPNTWFKICDVLLHSLRVHRITYMWPVISVLYVSVIMCSA